MRNVLQNRNSLREYLCIGIDIGGTNTDAVLLEGTRILASAKTNTTRDITQGVINSVNSLFELISLDKNEIDAVMIGTTHFVNSVLQAKELNEVLIIRLAKPATTAVEPLLDWPENLREKVEFISEIISGGYEYNGKEIAKLDCKRLEELAYLAKSKSIKAAAVTGVFAHVNSEQENEAYKILHAIYPEMQTTLSHKIGGLNLLTRENATILNAAVSVQFKKFYEGVKNAMRILELSQAKLFFSCNDGTLEHSQDIFPITTYGSGTSNSMRGAAMLTGLTEAIVADIGGTSTDVGILKNGFPLEAGYEIKIGDEEGVICNFPAPLTRSCGLGGGSIISFDKDIKVGPKSVGYKLNEEAIIFGGKVLTVTDIAVAKGRLSLGNADYLKALDRFVIDKADEAIHSKLIDMVNLIWHFAKSDIPITLILVGGGAGLFDKEILLNGLKGKIACIEMPEYAGNANALGAAVATISGNFNGIFQYTDMPGIPGTPREVALEIAKQKAIDDIVEKGANVDTVKVQDIEETPLGYLPGNQTRIQVKVIAERD